MSDNISTSTLEECIEQVMGVIDYFWDNDPRNEMTPAEREECKVNLREMMEACPLDVARQFTAMTIKQYLSTMKSGIDT